MNREDETVFLLFVCSSMISLVCVFVEAYLNRYSTFIYVAYIAAVAIYTVCHLFLENRKRSGGNGGIRPGWLYLAATLVAVAIFALLLSQYWRAFN